MVEQGGGKIINVVLMLPFQDGITVRTAAGMVTI